MLLPRIAKMILTTKLLFSYVCGQLQQTQHPFPIHTVLQNNVVSCLLEWLHFLWQILPKCLQVRMTRKPNISKQRWCANWRGACKQKYSHLPAALLLQESVGCRFVRCCEEYREHTAARAASSLGNNWLGWCKQFDLNGVAFSQASAEYLLCTHDLCLAPCLGGESHPEGHQSFGLLCNQCSVLFSWSSSISGQ